MGEEIVASYCLSNEQFPTKDQRKTALMQWGFTCTCQVLFCIFAGSILCGISHSSVLVMLLILLSQVCSLTGEELRRNEDARVEIQN